MRSVVVNDITLDGVMQGPGRPDEDTRGGFNHGGWGIPAATKRWRPRSARGWQV